MQRETREQETQNERSQKAKTTRTGLAGLPALARAIACICVISAAGGCGDDGSTSGGGDGNVAGPAYALNVVVFSPDGATSYVVPSRSLDIGAVALDGALEVPGFATIASAGEKVLVSSYPSPLVTQYELTDDLEWAKGSSLSFADYGTEDVGFAAQFFLNEHTAYLTYDITKRVVWDPVGFEILGAREQSTLSHDPQDGLSLAAAYNRTAWIPASGSAVLKPFYHRDDDGFVYAPNTQIVVYDRETHEERRILDAPCQGLENATQDGDGNTYFSTWNVTPTLYLYGQAPEPCFVRVRPDGTLDEQWSPRVSEWTGGRAPMVMRYLSDEKAIVSVLHHEEVDADWTGPYDDAVGAEVGSGGHFHLWMVDFANESASQIENVIGMDGQFHGKTIDGRVFVFLPYDDYSKTKVYEVLANGTAVERIDATGWIYDWVRVR